MANASRSRASYHRFKMTQRNLAFITGQVQDSKPLEERLLAQVECFVELGRRNIVVVVDTFPELDEATIDALCGLVRRAWELEADLRCVALSERARKALRTRPMMDSLPIIERVDEIPGAA